MPNPVTQAAPDWPPPIRTCSVCGAENVRSIPFDAGVATWRPDGTIQLNHRWSCIHVTDEKPRNLAVEVDDLKAELARLRRTLDL